MRFKLAHLYHLSNLTTLIDLPRINLLLSLLLLRKNRKKTKKKHHQQHVFSIKLSSLKKKKHEIKEKNTTRTL